jgi:DnaJ domain
VSDDFYGVLQVEPQAGDEAIRAAYRRLARLYHPDLNADPAAAERMRRINAAYAVLSDPSRRAAYDARRFLPTAPVATIVHPRRVAVQVAPPASNPPTPLQRSVDRIVAVIGVLLLLGIAFYTLNVIPYADQQFQQPGRYRSAAPVATADPQASEHPVGSVPDRLLNDDTLHRFPGPVVVAPTQLQPFANLPILRVEGTGQGIARYAIYYGNLNTGSATITGVVGRAALDGATPRVGDCPVDAQYCSGLVPGQISGPPGIELFRPPDLIQNYPAFVTHRVCCNGMFWSASWYEPRSNVTYTIDLARSIAMQYGSGSADNDLHAARTVAALADELVRLP